MDRKDKAAAGLLAGVKAGHAQARLDKRLAAEAGHAAAVALVPLDAVLDRPGGDTREPTADAVDALAESLDALGLLEPLVVDRRGRLLAGKTRLLALRRLQAKDPRRWGMVPVRRMVDLDAEADAGRALAVEIAENEQRKDYTAAEVRGLADRLKAAGFRATPGRPRKGTRALLPALGAVVGKSKRHLLRILAGETDGAGRTEPPTLAEACERLRRALLAFERVAGEAGRLKGNERRAVRDAAALAELLERIGGAHNAD